MEDKQDKMKDEIIKFEQDYKYNYFWIDYNIVIAVLQEKYSCNYNDIRDVVDDWLKNDNKLKQLQISYRSLHSTSQLKCDDKLKQLTSN